MEKAGPDIWPGLSASEFSAFLESGNISDYSGRTRRSPETVTWSAYGLSVPEHTVTTQVGNNMTAAASDFLVLESTVSYSNTSGSVVFEAPGSAVVVPLYEYTLTEGGSYYLVGARQQVTIN